MTRDEIITQVYSDSKIRGIIRALCYRYHRASLYDELLHHLIEYLCEMDSGKLIDLSSRGKLTSYSYAFVRSCLANPNHKFAKLYIQFDDLGDYSIEESTEDRITFDGFKDYCLSETQSGDTYTQLAAKVTYGYIIYKPKGRRSYRDYSRVSDIHYSSICEYVQHMRDQYEKHQVSIAE